MKEETTHQGQMCLVCHEISTPDCKICGKFATVQEIGSLEMTQYHYEMVEGKPKIIISMVKVLDTKGEYIKFAKLKEVEPFLSKYPVTFK
jgi:hypothetical protein|tara:strand:+ start:840 stop:1109 length:270 start_codon:yes stop_codon:yes gene_type:complete